MCYRSFKNVAPVSNVMKCWMSCKSDDDKEEEEQ
jgi:hypothetical protein